jgi:hypothetical protein
VGPAHGRVRPLRLDDRAPVRDGRAPARLPGDVAGAAHRPVSYADRRPTRGQRATQPVLTRRAPCPAGFGSGRDGGGPRPDRSSGSSSGRPPVRGDGDTKAYRRRSRARRPRSSVGSRSSGNAEASRTSLGLRPMSASSRRSILASALSAARAAATWNGHAARRLAPIPIVRHRRLSGIMGSILSCARIGREGLRRQRQFSTVTPNCTNPPAVQYG